MKRILFIAIVFCLMQSCMFPRPFIRPSPVFIENSHIEVDVIEDKIIVRIQTRHAPERYWGVRMINISDELHSSGIRLWGADYEYIYGDMFVMDSNITCNRMVYGFQAH